MSKQDNRSKGKDKTLSKLKGTANRELSSLKQLLSLLSVPASSPQVTTGNGSNAQHRHQLNSNSWNRNSRQQANEVLELERFSVTYRNHRDFSGHPLCALFLNIFTCLVKNRIVCSEWFHQALPNNILGVLICLRLLIRDPHHQRVFHELQGIDSLAMHMELVSNGYLEGGEQTFAVEKLVNMAYVFQKLAAIEEQRPWVTESGAHKTLVKLLATRDSSVLLGVLLALTSLAESPDCKEKIGELPVVGNLLVVLQEYNLLSKQVCVELLRLLCPSQQVRDQVRALDGVPVLLSLLHSDHLQLLCSTAWVLVQLCEDPETAAEIRLWGGPQQLLRILRSEQVYILDRSSVDTLSSANAAGRVHKECMAEELSLPEMLDNTLSLQAACCAALTELILDDSTAHQVVQENGVHIIGKLVLPHFSQPGPKPKSLQCYAFRTLRFLFSVERNRPLFKRLFPAELFAMFIDVGHYVRDIAAYEALQQKVSLLSEDDLISLRDNIERVSLDRSPMKVVNGYAVLDHLGSGAFGSVFKVRKQASQNLFALKEVILHNPAFGKDKKDRDVSVEKIVSELSIIKEQINHPNIVRYYKTFLENDKLYIVMELIEGAPLGEHFNSLKEKQQRFTEERVWNIFIQLCLALRYLHKEKRIIHRDLTPSNVMLGEKDKVTITDFGLAKQKEEKSKLTSVVGTILYSCPEIVKSEPYGEKADIWALGCLLYHMVVLRPPFYSSNMLSLATKIVEGIYEPVAEGVFSARVADIIKWCLTSDADLRPDIVEVSARISDLIMRFVDNLCASQHALERKLERDRKRAQKYFLEAKWGGATCRHLSLSQREVKRDTGVWSNGTIVTKRHSSDKPHTSPQGVQQSDDHGETKAVEGNPQLCMIQVPGRSTPDTPDTVSSGDLNTSNPDPTGPYKGLSMRPARRSVTASLSEEHTRACAEFLVPNVKPRPASAGICVSHRKVREIDDPVQRLLLLLHKIIYITQLPPSLQHNNRRRVIERFKKSLFDQHSSPYGLKMELHKLLQAAPDVVEQISTDRWSSLPSFGGGGLSSTVQGGMRCLALRDGVTYEQMLAMIEEELEENGYYSTSAHRGEHHPQ